VSALEPREDPRATDERTGLRGRYEVPVDDPPWPARPDGWRHDVPDPPDAFPVPFGPGDALLAVAWSVLAQVLVFLPVAASSLDIEQGPGLLIGLLAGQVLSLGGVLAWLARRGRLSWRLLGPVRPRLRDLGLGVAVGASGWLVVTLLLLLATLVVGEFEPPDQVLLERSTEGGIVTYLALAVAVLGAPVVEEVVFRGMLFQSLRYRIGLFPAMGISSIVWGLVHLLQPIYVVALALFGVWLAATFHRTGRLTVVVVAHATFNVIALLLSFTAT